MNFRTHVQPERVAFQIAPMVDILLFLLVFFMLTWNFSRNEAELDVKVPAAREGKENRRPAGEVILNVKRDGVIVMNRKVMSADETRETLSRISKRYAPISRSSCVGTRTSIIVMRVDAGYLPGCQYLERPFATSKPE